MSWEFEILDGPYGGTCEGSAWDGSALLFTHIPASRIMRYDPQTGSTTVYRENTNNSNGTVFDAQGILHACEGGGRRIVRFEPDGSATPLADSFEGRRLNQPNDLAIDLEGRVWFTDPFFDDARLVHDQGALQRRPGPRVGVPYRAGTRWRLVCASRDLRHHEAERHPVLPGPPEPVRRAERPRSGRAARAALVPGQQRRKPG